MMSYLSLSQSPLLSLLRKFASDHKSTLSKHTGSFRTTESHDCGFIKDGLLYLLTKLMLYWDQDFSLLQIFCHLEEGSRYVVDDIQMLHLIIYATLQPWLHTSWDRCRYVYGWSWIMSCCLTAHTSQSGCHLCMSCGKTQKISPTLDCVYAEEETIRNCLLA